MFIHKKTIISLVAVSFLSVIPAQGAQNSCKSRTTCTDCIQTEYCAWCMQPDYKAKNRCFNVSNYEYETTCSEEYIWNPDNEQRITLNRALLANTEEIVRVSPQRTNIKLKINQKYHIQMRYCAAEESSVEIKDTATDSVKINYYSACRTGQPAIPTNTCNGLKTNDVVTFTIEIEVLHCPKNAEDWLQTFQIYPVGVIENLVVDLELICDCPCERTDSPTYREKDERCNYMGTYKCGACDCKDGYYGHHCECFGGVHQQVEECTRDNITTVECSGRGICVCGICECEQREIPEEIISGKYCECDNFSCDRTNGVLCSGPGNGECVCGSCLCQPGWTGPACNCKTTKETCIAPNAGAGDICSGQGECSCGVCRCDFPYTGRYCEAHNQLIGSNF